MTINKTMEITFNWIGGATFVMTIGDLKIACDPVLCEKGTVQDYFWFRSRRLEQPMYTPITFSGIDLWLLTHHHEDHLDSIGMSKIDPQARVISNGNALKKLAGRGITDLTVLTWHTSKKISIKGFEINIEAIPAIHGINPLSAFFAGNVNGYYLIISKGYEKLRVYITGDTVYKSKVINALKGKVIDLLIANMGAAKEGNWIMTLTLNSKMLKKMILKINPKTVIPVHFGTFEHYSEPVEKIEALTDERIKLLKAGESIKLEV